MRFAHAHTSTDFVKGIAAIHRKELLVLAYQSHTAIAADAHVFGLKGVLVGVDFERGIGLGGLRVLLEKPNGVSW